MARQRLNDGKALALALGPAVALTVVLVLGGFVEAGPAVLLLAAIAFGGLVLAGRPTAEVADTPVLPPQPPTTLLQDVLDEIPDPVILLSGERAIIAVNRNARETLGVGMLGRHLALSLRHPAVLAAVDTVASGVPSITEEIALPVPVVRTFTLSVGALPPWLTTDEPRIVLVLHDETRAKKAEQTRADFVANASHELRSPLSAVIGFIETLRGHARDDPEARDHFLGVMHKEAQRIARLIDGLLSLSTVEMNEHVPPRDVVDIGAVVNGVADSLEVRADDKGMGVLVDCTEPAPKVIGDADQLAQVFQNLTDNAIKYGREGTPVRITIRPLDRMPGSVGPAASVAVVDEGDGIQEAHLPRLTERFYRADEGRSRRLGGTGLGLAIVKHIVSRHRGQLKVESRPGIGSTFTVFLPAADPGRPTAEPAS